MALSLLGIVSYSFKTKWFGKDYHASFIVVMNSSADLNSFFFFAISLFIFSHIISIGLRCGDWGGHSIFGIPRFSRYLWVEAAVWGLALSSMKKYDCQLYFSLIASIRLSSNTEKYFSEFKFPLTRVKEPIPAPVIQPLPWRVYCFVGCWRCDHGDYISQQILAIFSFFLVPL